MDKKSELEKLAQKVGKKGAKMLGKNNKCRNQQPCAKNQQNCAQKLRAIQKISTAVRN